VGMEPVPAGMAADLMEGQKPRAALSDMLWMRLNNSTWKPDHTTRLVSIARGCKESVYCPRIKKAEGGRLRRLGEPSVSR